MKRLLKLYKMLKKNGRSSEEANGGIRLDAGSLLWPVIGLLIALGLGYACWKYAPYIEVMGGAGSILTTLGLVAAVLILVIGILSLINGMYMSSDIELLITLPFTSCQIAVLRLLPFLQLALGGTVLCILGPCIGLSLASPIPAATWLAVILGAVLTPIFVLSVAAILVILLMSFLKFFRSREVLRYIGMGFLFIALCAYMYVCAGHSNVDLKAVIANMMTASDKISYFVPVIGFTSDFIKTGNALLLLAAVLATAAAVGLFLLVTKALYLRGALNMQEAGNSKVLTDAAFEKRCQKKSVMKALMGKEFLMTRRNPTYLLYNFIIGLLWPVLAVILMMQVIPVVREALAEPDAQSLLASFNLPGVIIVSGVIAIVALVVASLPLSMFTLAYSSLSREGKSFYMMKQIPVAYEVQLEAKRRMADKVAQFSVTGYTALLLILVSIFLKIPFVFCIPPIIFVGVATEFHVNLSMYQGICNAFVTWDNEKSATTKSTPAAIIGFLPLYVIAAAIGGIIYLYAGMQMNTAICTALLVALCALILAAALLFKKRIMTVGVKTIRRMRF